MKTQMTKPVAGKATYSDGYKQLALELEMNLRSLGSAVLLPEVPVGLHCKRAAARMPEPPRDGWNIDHYRRA